MRKQRVGALGLVLLCAGLLLTVTVSAQTSDVQSAAEAQAAQANIAAQLSRASSGQAAVNEKEASLPEQKDPAGTSPEELKLMEELQGKEPPALEESAFSVLPAEVGYEEDFRGPCLGDKDINGAGTAAWTYTLNTYWHDRRSTTIYLASEFGCDTGGPISGIRYYVSVIPGMMMTDLTVRLRHTTAASYASPYCFNNDGWTVCYEANTTITVTGWYTFPFATAFSYNGVDNLEVDVSFNNSGYLGQGTIYSFTGTGNRTMYAYCDSCNGDPKLWTCTGSPTVYGSTSVPRAQFIFPPPATGACCVNYACVATNTNPECTAMGGTWYGGQDCATFYCPPWNDNCSAVTPVALTPGTPVTFTGNNLGATNDCGSFPGGQVWHAITLPGVDSFFDVWLDYCTTNNGGFPFGNAWLNWATGCPCTGVTVAGTFDTTTCGDGNITIKWSGLASGTYYYPVLLDAANHAAGDYTLHVVCMPAYCASYATSTADETLKTVQFGMIDNTTTNCDTYDNFTYLSTDVIAGSTYPFNIIIGDCEGVSCYSKRLAIFIDLNQDFDFTDTGERVYNSGQLTNTPCPDFPLAGNVTIPATATVGCTRMRIVVVETSSTDPSSCGTYTWGATEDYTVCILPPGEEGACCFGTSCTPDMYQLDCELAGGRYKGNGTTCEPLNPCFGACCFMDGSCLETLDLAECAGLGGTYSGDGTTCTPNLCPQPGNNCANPMPIVLSPGSLPLVDADTTCGRVNDYADTCLGYYDGGEDMIYSVLVTDPMCVSIAVAGTTWVGVAIDTSCPPGATCLAYATSSGCCPVIQSVNLNPGMYYIMIDTWPSPTCTDFTMTISACPQPAACCFSDGSCQMLLATACVTAGGIFQGEGTTCDPNPCEPTYCPAGSTYVNCDEYISRVQLGTIDNATGCSQPGGYGDYTYLSADLIYTVGTPITVTNGHPYSSDQCMVWIDWNHDLDFYDPGEAITMTGSPGNGPYTTLIIAQWPEVLSGPTRMRVRITYTGLVDPCGFATYGEVEDYTVNIIEVPGACCWGDGTCTNELPSMCGGFYGGPYTQCAGTDCNLNGIDDFCDIISEFSTDCNGNGIPDECDPWQDCNNNLIQDFCDIANCDGSAWCSDCNGNGKPDECDVPPPYGICEGPDCSLDCQPNGVPDECDIAGVPYTYQYDDGTSGNALGNGSYNHEICWIHHFTVANRTPIQAIETSFGTPAYPGGSGVTPGMTFRVFVWSDPNGDGDPTDAVLLAQANGTAEAGSIDTDVLQSVPISAEVSGSFFVGASIEGMGYQAPMDEDEPLAHESWGAYTTTPPIDPTNFAAILFNNDTAGFPCDWMLRAATLVTGDCNGNGRPDFCDVPPPCGNCQGPDCSQDCNGDCVPDECQLEGNDCNGNDRPDDCDIASGYSLDCQPNGIPDECELDGDDCNGNLVPDECDIATGFSQDCQPNGIPDECDIANGTSCDCQGDTIPDECQLADKAREELLWDDGSSENSLGLTAGGEMCWMTHFTTPEPSCTVLGIKTCFGSPLYPGGSGVSAGQPVRVYVWSDPNGDGNPADAVFLGEATGTVSGGSIDTDVFQTVTINTPVSGSFFVGASTVTAASTYPGPMDENGPQANEAWLTFNAVPFDPANITANLYNMTDIGYPCNWLLRAEITCGPLANDCNENGIPDECDIGVQWDGFCATPGIPCFPPECDSDWNHNGVPDTCPDEICGDLDNDDNVDLDDYWVFLDAFGTCVGHPKYNALADMDGDGCVTLVDYQAWRMCYKMANGKDFVAPKPKPMPKPAKGAVVK
jgi:hypothetical protein